MGKQTRDSGKPSPKQQCRWIKMRSWLVWHNYSTTPLPSHRVSTFLANKHTADLTHSHVSPEWISKHKNFTLPAPLWFDNKPLMNLARGLCVTLLPTWPRRHPNWRHSLGHHLPTPRKSNTRENENTVVVSSWRSRYEWPTTGLKPVLLPLRSR